eukprot:606896_1
MKRNVTSQLRRMSHVHFTTEELHLFNVGYRMYHQHDCGKRILCIIIDKDEEENEIKIHYLSRHMNHNRWVPITTHETQKINYSFTKYNPESERDGKIATEHPMRFKENEKIDFFHDQKGWMPAKLLRLDIRQTQAIVIYQDKEFNKIRKYWVDIQKIRKYQTMAMFYLGHVHAKHFKRAVFERYIADETTINLYSFERQLQQRVQRERNRLNLCAIQSDDDSENEPILPLHQERMMKSKKKKRICRTKHMDEERPYKCSKCQKRYKKRSHLTAHFTAIHTNLKPFECPYCSKAFTYYHQCKNHVEKQHEEPNFKPKKTKSKCDINTI